jgi:hypothetical protein
MDKPTRRVVVSLIAILGASFVVLAVFAFVRGDGSPLPAVWLLLGTLYLMGSYVIWRRAPKL